VHWLVIHCKQSKFVPLKNRGPMILNALIAHQTPNPRSCKGNSRTAKGAPERHGLLLSAVFVLYFCLEPNLSKLFRNFLSILLFKWGIFFLRSSRHYFPRHLLCRSIDNEQVFRDDSPMTVLVTVALIHNKQSMLQPTATPVSAKLRRTCFSSTRYRT